MRERLRAEIAHETAGRLRLHAESLRGDREACRLLASKLDAVDMLNSARVRAGTGSIILIYEEQDRADVLSAVASQIDICAADRSPRSPTRPIAWAVETFRRADRYFVRASGERLSFADAAFVLLCVTAAVQIGRGAWAAPASGLLWGAFILAARSQRDRGALA
jgi:hypothetical protein